MTVVSLSIEVVTHGDRIQDDGVSCSDTCDHSQHSSKTLLNQVVKGRSKKTAETQAIGFKTFFLSLS